MTTEQLRDRLAGGYHKTLTGNIPEDSISLEGLIGVLSELTTEKGFKQSLRPGVTLTANGKYMLAGKFIRSTEALV